MQFCNFSQFRYGHHWDHEETTRFGCFHKPIRLGTRLIHTRCHEWSMEISPCFQKKSHTSLVFSEFLWGVPLPLGSACFKYESSSPKHQSYKSPNFTSKWLCRTSNRVGQPFCQVHLQLFGASGHVEWHFRTNKIFRQRGLRWATYSWHTPVP